MKTPTSLIMNAVAYPPTLLFAPVELAGINMAFNVGGMIIANASFNVTPIIFLVTLVIGHVVSAFAYARDAHIVYIGQAIGRYPLRSRNLVPSEEGVKYVP